jgi:predicted alpha/beta-fold hydrolase
MILSHSRPLRLALPVGGIVLTGALSIAAYTARSLNTRDADRRWMALRLPLGGTGSLRISRICHGRWRDHSRLVVPRQESNQVVVGCTGHQGVKSDLLGIGSGLWRAGNNVLLFDFRGCGESDEAPPSLAHNELPDARAAVLYAQRRLPGARLGLIGYSMGQRWRSW